MASHARTDKLEKLFRQQVLEVRPEESFFSERFQYNGVLGKGSFGLVVSALWKAGGNQLVALKLFDKSEFREDAIKIFTWEGKVTQKYTHQHILACLAVLHSPNHLYLVFPLMEGGTLEAYMRRRFAEQRSFQEAEVATVVGRLLGAIQYLQDNSIIHRDIKPDNILLENPDDLESLRLADFGLAVRTGSDRNAALSLKCGTAPYMAPEMNIEAACYTNLVDVWSVGIVMYRLLRDGKAPFTLEELQLLAREPDTSVDLRFRKINCSFNCIHLLTSLLAPDPFKRCPSYMAIEHPFITGDPHSLPPLMFSELERARETRHRISMVFRFLVVMKKVSPERRKFKLNLNFNKGKDHSVSSAASAKKNFKISVTKPLELKQQDILTRRKITLQIDSRSRDHETGSGEHSRGEVLSRGTLKSFDSGGDDHNLKTPLNRKPQTKAHKRVASNYIAKESLNQNPKAQIPANLNIPNSANMQSLRKSASCAKNLSEAFGLPPLPNRPPRYKVTPQISKRAL